MDGAALNPSAARTGEEPDLPILRPRTPQRLKLRGPTNDSRQGRGIFTQWPRSGQSTDRAIGHRPDQAGAGAPGCA
eukprot:14483453-Alexandrium_andersonii.AAC.1